MRSSIQIVQFPQQPSLKLELPKSSQAQKEGVTTNEPPFVVSITDSNVIILGGDKFPIEFVTLKARLQQEVAKNPELKLTIHADKNSHWDRIVGVMDIAKELKIKSVSASTTAAKEAAKP